MRILNYGSLNLDYVYTVDHIVCPGETISSVNLELFCGGKGLNQSIALARAGVQVFHAGMVGEDGGMLLNACKDNGVDTRFVRKVDERSGNAMIQVSKTGQNSIVLFGGANQKNNEAYVDETLSHFGGGDWLLLQNEVNLLAYMIEKASAAGMRIALNPSPYNDLVAKCDLSKISLFLLNEVEGNQITGETESDAILSAMRTRFSKAQTVLTLGKDGVVYQTEGGRYQHGIYDVPVVDTTAAGDTFTGYFLAALVIGESPAEALRRASVASSLAVSKKGAAGSVPTKEDVERANLGQVSPGE